MNEVARGVAPLDAKELFARVEQHIADYDSGGADRGEEDVRAAEQLSVGGKVKEIWATARRQRLAARIVKRLMPEGEEAGPPTAQAEAQQEPANGPVFKSPAIQPSIAAAEKSPSAQDWELSLKEEREEREAREAACRGLATKVATKPSVSAASPDGAPSKTTDDVGRELKTTPSAQPEKTELVVAQRGRLAFQHAKNPAGIPASLENAQIAIDALNLDCRYDVFHDRIIVKGHDSKIRGDALENLDRA
jgi:hypothetical protein